MNTRQAATDADYARRLGVRLRRARRARGWSLADIEKRSGGVWKAVVIGSYERGDRAITVGRLAALATFYGLPVAALLPDAGDPAATVDKLRRVLRGALADLGGES